jgi:peptidoglycan/LPS O-acetylase OafA/YrhL
MNLLKEKKSLDTLTAFRGLLAMWVVLHHYNFDFKMHKFDFSFFEPITSKGYYAVGGFFILSGFIVSCAYLNMLSKFNFKNTLKFFVLRLVRIYPIHIVTILFYVFAVYVFKLKILETSFTGMDFVYNILLIHAWGFCKDFSWNGPSWTLSAEWFLYLTFPFVAILFSKLKGLKTNILLIVTIILFEYFIKTQDLSQVNFFYFHGVVRGFFQFLYGVILFNIYSIFPKKNILYDYISILTFLSLLLVVYFSADQILDIHAYYSNQDMLIMLLMAGLVFSLSKCNGLILKIFNSKFLQRLGLISYSIYMVHTPIGQVMQSLFISNNIKNNLFFMPLYVLLVLVVADVTYRYVEAPTREYIKKKVRLVC